MPISCVFQLERVSAVYKTGENITGRIILNTENVTVVKAVFVNLEGEAVVKWTTKDDGAPVDYFSQQQLIQNRIKVFNGTNFPAGKHVYRISLPIPPTCPSTCEGRFGHISYDISVRLDRNWSFDKVFRKTITIYQALDLNDYPEYKLPVKDESTKFFCQWPCRSGPILSTLVIPCGGYVPKQKILFFVTIDNQSQYDVPGIEARLYQHFVFMASEPVNRKRRSKVLVHTSMTESTLRLSKCVYEGILVVPPNTQRTTLNDTHIVSLHYELQVKLKTGQLHYDIDLTIPIVIGTVPLQRSQSDNAMFAMQPTALAEQNRSRRGSIETLNDDENITNMIDIIDLPSYDCCALPPSFTDATLSSLQTADDSQHETNERQQLNIQLPQFPGYNTFACRTQAENNTSHPDLDYDH